MKISTKISQDIDMSVWDSIVAKSLKLDDYEVEYGFYDSQSHPDSGLSLGKMAYINEYGSNWFNIPSRPFMYQTAIHQQSDKMMYTQYVDMLFKKKPLRTALKEIGERGTLMVEQIIELGNFEENSAFTIALKGSARPLIDTGYLKSHAKSKVQRSQIE